MLENLQPTAVFRYFEEICQIPHGSGNTKRISDYLADFARAHGLFCVQDRLNNIIIKKAGTPGYEGKEPVILQGHMDMVCEKDADCPLDMKKDGLVLAVDGDYVYARGTTLGGDDGIAVAFALALLDADDIPHPPLEIVITTEEETGMDGASNIDLSVLGGNRLINLDSEEEGHLLCGCAGGMRCDCVFDAPPVSRNKAEEPQFDASLRIAVSGLLGGHSGTEIDKGHANANCLLGALLSDLAEEYPFGLTALSGGGKDNAIPRSAEAVLAVRGADAKAMTARARRFADERKAYYQTADPNIAFSVSGESIAPDTYVCASQSAQIARFLFAAPNGVQAMSTDVPGLAETSLNLGIMQLANGKFTATYSLRSMYAAQKELLARRLRLLAESFGASVSIGSSYPGWAFARTSPLRDTMCAVYERMFGKRPQIEVMHAGLECGLLLEKRPTLDCVSIGPNIPDIHTTAERLSISSTKRTWAYLCAILKEL